MFGTVSEEAFKHYEAGRRAYNVESHKNLKRCRSYFKRALKEDPNFGRALGWLSYTYTQEYIGGWADESALHEAERLAQKAVDLNPNDFHNRWDLAFAKLYRRNHGNAKSMTGAIGEYLEARKLWKAKGQDKEKFDGRGDLYAEAGEALVYIGQNHDEAAALIARSTPDWWRWNLAFAFYFAKEYDKAWHELCLMATKPLDNKPGDKGFINHYLLLEAAVRWRRNATIDRVSDRRRAKQRMTLFRKAEPKWSVEKEDKVAPLCDPKDRLHWLEALRAAGLPGKIAKAMPPRI